MNDIDIKIIEGLLFSICALLAGKIDNRVSYILYMFGSIFCFIYAMLMSIVNTHG
jgi:hypothetical protein